LHQQVAADATGGIVQRLGGRVAVRDRSNRSVDLAVFTLQQQKNTKIITMPAVPAVSGLDRAVPKQCESAPSRLDNLDLHDLRRRAAV
jgi:hypothetical protein